MTVSCGDDGHDYTDHLVEIVGMEDIANRLSVQIRTVYQWRQRGVIPPPDLHTKPAIWYWSTIQQWAMETGRLSR